MPQTIDVTGLTPEAIRVVETVVDALRKQSPPPTAPQSSYWPGPPPGETAEEWIARLRAWCERQPRLDVIADDSRESIYEGRGE